MYAAFNTNAAASTGVIGWVMVEYLKNGRKFSVVGACSGAIAGLVGITPAAGYVSVWCAALIGFVTGIVCSSLQNLNEWIHIDEGMDVFKLHGIGGMVGSFMVSDLAGTLCSSASNRFFVLTSIGLPTPVLTPRASTDWNFRHLMGFCTRWCIIILRRYRRQRGTSRPSVRRDRGHLSIFLHRVLWPALHTQVHSRHASTRD